MTDNRFEERISESCGDGLQGIDLLTLQVNLGLICNQQCRHCHLGCSPQRTEQMDWPVMEAILATLQDAHVDVVDLTGGAPELNRYFRRFVEALRAAGQQIQIRTNLTVLLEGGMETMGRFLADHHVDLVASMPCYLEENVDAQRGGGTYRRSIESLRHLNELGYGRSGGGRPGLGYKPRGPRPPPGPTPSGPSCHRSRQSWSGTTRSS